MQILKDGAIRLLSSLRYGLAILALSVVYGIGAIGGLAMSVVGLTGVAAISSTPVQARRRHRHHHHHRRHRHRWHHHHGHHHHHRRRHRHHHHHHHRHRR